MKVQASHSEQGQVLVLIILSLVALLGFASLAIDGGMIYSERRVAQNAADASAYAGAASLSQELKNFSPGDLDCAEFNDGTHAWNSNSTKKPHFASRAVDRADDNTFTITYKTDPTSVTANDNAVWMVCGFDAALDVNFVDVHVRITKQVSTSLMHLFYDGPAVNTVDSVVRVYSPAGVATGAVIVALCTNGSDTHDGLNFGGNTNIRVSRGRAISNCNLNFNGASGTYYVPDGITHVTGVTGNNNLTLTPPTTVSSASPISFPYSFSDTLNRRCNDAYPSSPVDITVNGANNTETWGPGKYDRIRVNSGSLFLTPGLYCIYGDVSINSTNARITVDGVSYVLYGKDVTFYMPETAGSFTINGGSTSYLTAAQVECYQGSGACTTLPLLHQPVRGLLMWYDPQFETVTLNGDGDSVFEGTLAAPYSTVKLVGSSGVTTSFGLQVIADDVDASGGSEIEIHYDATRLFSTDTQMGLEK